MLAELQDRCAVFGRCILKCGQIKVRPDMGIGPYIVDADSILPVADL